MIGPNDVFNGVQAVIARTTGGRVICKINSHTRRGVVIKGGIVIALTHQNVVAFATAQLIVTCSTNQRVITNTAVDQVIAITTIKIIITGTAMNIVMAKFTTDRVIARIAPQGIGPRTTINGDIAIGNRIAGQINNVIARTRIDDFNPVKSGTISGRILNDGVKAD